MTFQWYQLFNLQDFLDTGLVSRTLDIFLSGIGQVEIVIQRGNFTSVQYDDALLPIGFNGENPYNAVQGKYAVYQDGAGMIFLGVANP